MHATYQKTPLEDMCVLYLYTLEILTTYFTKAWENSHRTTLIVLEGSTRSVYFGGAHRYSLGL